MREYLVEYCAEQMLGHLSEEPVTFAELEWRVPYGNCDERRQAIRKLRRRGLAVYLRASEGGPGWVRVLTPPRSAR